VSRFVSYKIDTHIQTYTEYITWPYRGRKTWRHCKIQSNKFEAIQWAALRCYTNVEQNM